MPQLNAHELIAWSILNAAYQRCNDNVNSKLLPTSPALVQNNPIAIVSGKADYRLSFDIVPTGTVVDWASILHFTIKFGSNCCELGSRSPAFFFGPSTTRLYVVIGDYTNDNWGIDTVELPLNVRTKVSLECMGKDVKLTVEEKVYNATQPTYRFAGNLIVFAGDPWYQPAIYNLDYKILPAAEVKAGKASMLM